MRKLFINKIIILLLANLFFWLPIALELTLELRIPFFGTIQLLFLALSIICFILFGFFIKVDVLNTVIAIFASNVILILINVIDINRNVAGGWQIYGHSLLALIVFTFLSTALYSSLYYFGYFLSKKYS